MKRAANLARYTYTNRFVRYVFVGFSTFCIDFGLLFLLHGFWNINLVVATSIAYWASITYNFTFNRWWTFNNTDRQNLRKNLTGYLLLLGFNYLFTVIFVKLASNHINYGLAKVIAVAIQVSWTFPIYKYVVFSKKSGDLSPTE